MWIFLFFNQSWIIMEFHFSNQSVCYGFWFFKLKLKCCGINPVAVGTSGDFSTTPNWSGKGSKKIPTSCCVAASASSYAAPTSCTVNVASGTYQTQVWCFAFLFSVCIDRVGRAHAVIKETCIVTDSTWCLILQTVAWILFEHLLFLRIGKSL